MIGLKTQMTMAVILAVVSGLLFTGIFVLFPNQTQDQMPIPRPSPSILEQVSWAMLWIGLAAVIALIIVVVILLINRVIRKKTPEEFEAQAELIDIDPSEESTKNSQLVGES